MNATEEIRQRKAAIAAYKVSLASGKHKDGTAISLRERNDLAHAIVILQGQMATILGAMPH